MTIGKNVAAIGTEAFSWCGSLTSVNFRGNPPSLGMAVFYGANNATVYHEPGTTGWDSTFGERPTAWWYLPSPSILDFGVGFGLQSNRFGFVISWATNASVVVETTTNLANSTWSAVGTNTLTGGSSYFSDPQWTNHPARFYRLRSP